MSTLWLNSYSYAFVQEERLRRLSKGERVVVLKDKDIAELQYLQRKDSERSDAAILLLYGDHHISSRRNWGERAMVWALRPDVVKAPKIHHAGGYVTLRIRPVEE